MRKVILNDIKIISEISKTDSAKIFLTSTGELLKLFLPEMLKLLNLINYDMEKKILSVDNYKMHNRIIKPNAGVYLNNGMFCGYLMNRAKGVDYNTFSNNATYKQLTDLEKYKVIHSQIENIVKKSPDIVFPDLCTCDNIFIDKESVQLIDYDGFQVGNYPTMVMSTSLGNQEAYYIKKYLKGDNLFNKNLDKKSLIILYFLDTFNIDLNKVGVINPFTRKPVTLANVFEEINLDDYRMYEKVSKIFDDSVDNEYLGEEIERLAKDYKLIMLEPNLKINGAYIKRLIKK